MNAPIITSTKLREVVDWYPGQPDWKAAMLYAADEIDRLTAALAAREGVVVSREDAAHSALSLACHAKSLSDAAEHVRADVLFASAERINAALEKTP